MATVNTSFNPGFVQATSLPSEQTQTFATSPSATSQTFGISDVPTRSGFMGSLAPTGPGKSSTSTVPTFKDTSSSSSSDFGTVAKVGGGITLAMLLNSMGSKGGGGGGGVTITGVLGGLSKVAKLAKMAGVDVEKYVSNILEGSTSPSEISTEMDNLSKWLNPDGPKIPFETTTGSSQFEAANELARLNAQPPPSTPNQLANPDMYPNVTAPLSQAAQTYVSAFNSGSVAANATVNSANAAALGIDTFGGLGVPATAYSAAAMGGAGISGLGFGATGSIGAQAAVSAGGIGAGAALSALAGPLAIVGLAMMAKGLSESNKDLTWNSRYASRLENIYQDITSGKTTEQQGLDNLLQIARAGQGAHAVEVMRIAAENEELPFSEVGGRSGETRIHGWSPASAELFEKFQPALKRGVWEGGKFDMEPQGPEERTLYETPRLTPQDYAGAGFAVPSAGAYDAVHPDARRRAAERTMIGDQQTGLGGWADFLSDEQVKEKQMESLTS